MKQQLKRDATRVVEEAVAYAKHAQRKSIRIVDDPELIEIMAAYCWREMHDRAEISDGNVRIYTGGLAPLIHELCPLARNYAKQPFTAPVISALEASGLLRRSSPRSLNWEIAEANEEFADVEEDGQTTGTAVVLAQQSMNGATPQLGDALMVVGMNLDVDGDGRTRIQLRHADGRALEVYAS